MCSQDERFEADLYQRLQVCEPYCKLLSVFSILLSASHLGCGVKFWALVSAVALLDAAQAFKTTRTLGIPSWHFICALPAHVASRLVEAWAWTRLGLHSHGYWNSMSQFALELKLHLADKELPSTRIGVLGMSPTYDV